ncbi:MAG TPA: phosphate ABC transporter permease subunit PstC [Chthoniobacteraceae bacterium]|jgi:phosphate transport system permease protein|nr:phosphate ABC transporter permease subunit PstC [Chthoniobacteraceae bacterium]
MNPPAAALAVPPNAGLLPPPSRYGDTLFRWVTVAMAFSLIVLVVLVGWELWHGSQLARAKFGVSFLTSSEWDPVQEKYGALPFIFGTLVSSIIALLIAVPLSIGTAIFLTEMAPQWMRQPLVSLIEMLAAIPSVILGLWGIFVMVPYLRDGPFAWLSAATGRWSPLFAGPVYGVSMLAGGIIVAIMILPIITSISREILRSVPNLQREAAYALGATRWEVTRIAVLSYARKGLFGAVTLGLGRALGETMAVTMVIGNRPEIAKSLLAPGYTLASVIANEFNEATTATYTSALIELGLVLLAVTIVINLFAQLLLRGFGGRAPARA